MSKIPPKAMPAPLQGNLELPLPSWNEMFRAFPRPALYSALFAPVRRGVKRPAVQREVIAAIGGFGIVYTGFRLDQGDLDVFGYMVQLASKDRPGKRIDFRTREVLAALGRSDGKSDRDWLLSSLSRLQACAVEITKDGLSYSGSLISEQARSEKTGTHYVALNPRLADLYAVGYAQIKWEHRQALIGKPLAQWLQAFCAETGFKPLTVPTEKLMEFSNSGYKRIRDFKRAIDEAANEVAKVTGLTWSWGPRATNVTFSTPAKPKFAFGPKA